MNFPWFKMKKNHLEYTSIASWYHGESVPKGFGMEYGSGRRPDFKVYVQQYGELRQHLFNEHLKKLPYEIQEQLKTRQHPSQSHSRIKEAEPVQRRLKDKLVGLDFVEEVSIKNAQMDLVQFNVKLKNEPTLEQWEMIPEYLEGYVINTVWIQNG